MSEKQIEQIAVIIKQGNMVIVKWGDGIPASAKIQILNSLMFAEHEKMITEKLTTKSNVINPYTGKQAIIQKELN